MNKLACDIEIIFFNSTVIRKCRNCNIISTTGDEIPCQILHELELTDLENKIDDLKNELLIDLIENEPENEPEEKPEEEPEETISSEHKKLKNLIGIK